MLEKTLSVTCLGIHLGVLLCINLYAIQSHFVWQTVFLNVISNTLYHLCQATRG